VWIVYTALCDQQATIVSCLFKLVFHDANTDTDTDTDSSDTATVFISDTRYFLDTTRLNYTKFVCMLPVAVARSLSVMYLCYILPVLWMTSCFHLVAL